MGASFTGSGMLDMNRINFFSVLDHHDDGVIIADMDGVIHFYNPAHSKIDGILPEKAMGHKVTDIYELNNRTSMIMQCALHKSAIKNRIFFYRTISGKVANTVTSVYPFVDVQAKLLRAIQEKQVRRLGSVKEIAVDVGAPTAIFPLSVYTGLQKGGKLGEDINMWVLPWCGTVWHLQGTAPAQDTTPRET